MNTLQTELRRLYLPDSPQADAQNRVGSEAGLIDASGHVRAMVLEVAQLAGCSSALALWHGVQDELGLPAPAMAVSGISGFQVWFSLREPMPVAQAMALLDMLRLRFLAEVAPRHVTPWPAADASGLARHAPLVPALQTETRQWSAFVAPGLISMFADEPWLDLPPSAEAQAKLLANFESIQPAQLQHALERLQPTPSKATPDADAAAVAKAGSSAAPEAPHGSAYNTMDPKRFLLAVMNDPTAELALRIEAAKALLPYRAEP